MKAFAVVAHRVTPTNTRLGTVLSPAQALTRLAPGDIALGRLDVLESLDGVEPGLWALDRLHRRPVELEQFMDLAERRGVLLASVAGEVDLSTGDGQFHARIMGAVAAKERAPSAAVSAASNRSCANRASPSVAGSAPTATARTA